MIREQRQQILREQQRQRMASLQAKSAAFNSPLKVDMSDVAGTSRRHAGIAPRATATPNTNSSSDLYAAALKPAAAGQRGEQIGQGAKEEFYNSDPKAFGYLPN